MIQETALRIISRIERLIDEARYKRYRQRYDIDPSFRFNGRGILLYGEGTISLGPKGYIGRFSSIQSREGCVVKIGKCCSISHYVMIYTENYVADQDFSRSRMTKKGNVTIGDYCLVGAHVFIREGVTIGDNVVIGANSVVTHDIPSFSIAAGAPARVVRVKAP